MRLSRTKAAARALALVAATALTLTGCGLQDQTAGDGTAADGADAAGDAADTALRNNSDDRYQPLPAHVFLPDGASTEVWSEYLPDEITTGTRLPECGSIMVTYDTVPTLVYTPEQAATSALDFLIDSAQYHIGQPAYLNPLGLSYQTLQVSQVSTEGDTVTVELTGQLATGGYCESEKARAQIAATAMAATNTEEAVITLNGENLETHLGLGPYQTGEEVTF